MVDKDFTYQVINELREVGSKKPIGDYDRTLMLAAANVMEINIRAYLDIASEQPVQTDAVRCPNIGCNYQNDGVCVGIPCEHIRTA
jgi:hypothetical protein